MSHTLENLQQRLESRFGEAILAAVIALDELTITVCPKAWRVVASALRDEFGFEQLVDLCGMDYSAYADRVWEKPRYAAVTHLLSVQHNVRLRVKVFAADDDFPLIDSVNEVWSSANWYEREAFDLYGIVFVDHPDLRRLLTDYGFIGHPFRKDFPISGFVEMRYDPEQRRVIYQPATIEPRENTPRIVREENYGV